MLRKFWSGLLTLVVGSFLLGCECQKRCDTCPQKDTGCGEGVVSECTVVPVVQEKLNCPTCRNQVTIYTPDGKTESGCTKCEVTTREKPTIECRPPKVTPKASPCPPCP